MTRGEAFGLALELQKRKREPSALRGILVDVEDPQDPSAYATVRHQVVNGYAQVVVRIHRHAGESIKRWF